MAHKIKNTYYCSYCNKPYSDPVKADGCRDSHDLIYIPLTKEDLNRLVNYIHTHDDELITESLLKTLYKYLKAAALG